VITNRGGPFVESNGGVDGNGNFGLPRIPQGPDTGVLAYGGDSGIVIPTGGAQDVTCLEYRGRPESPPTSVWIECELGAERIDVIKKTVTIAL
jgi:hypothetical protein